jgi:beta-phosphoglucomutase
MTKKEHQIRAILFDMDGVLIDAKEWHFDSLNQALTLFGMPISRFDHLTTFDGLPTRKKLEMLTLERGLPRELHDFLNEMKQQYTMQMVHAKCKPTFIHEYALSSLKAKGYRIAVCSNSVRATIDLMMLKAGLSSYIDLVLSNQDVTNAKPHPEIYQRAMEHFDLDPQCCLIVEDNENGIKAAQASGGHLLAVSNVEETNFQNIMSRISQLEIEMREEAI